MNFLSYRETTQNGLSFELMIDDKFVGKLVGGEEGGIPHWIIEDDLPTKGFDEPDRRIVSVCTCGEYGCGNTSCKVEVGADVVRFCEFSSVEESTGVEFTVTSVNYRDVLTSIVGKAKAYREMKK